MKSSAKFLLLLSVAIFGIGVASAVLGGLRMRVSAQNLTRQRSLLAKVKELEKRENAVAAARARLSEIAGESPADLDEILRTEGLSELVSSTREELQPTGEGWSVLIKEISMNDVVLSDLDRFMCASQEGRPPWLAAKIVLRSSPFESGRAQAVLTMQALRPQQK